MTLAPELRITPSLFEKVVPEPLFGLLYICPLTAMATIYLLPSDLLTGHVEGT